MAFGPRRPRPTRGFFPSRFDLPNPQQAAPTIACPNSTCVPLPPRALDSAALGFIGKLRPLSAPWRLVAVFSSVKTPANRLNHPNAKRVGFPTCFPRENVCLFRIGRPYPRGLAHVHPKAADKRVSLLVKPFPDAAPVENPGLRPTPPLLQFDKSSRSPGRSHPQR